MKDIIINFLIGMFFGMLVTVGLIASTERIKTEQSQSKFEIKENVSLRPPRELPKDEIEYDEIKIPTNLREVIL